MEAAQTVVGTSQTNRAAYADKAYDSQGNRVYCRLHGLKDAIAERGKKESGLGRRRWVIERTFAWLKLYRRLATRYERRADIHLGLLLLGCALIASNFCR